MNKIKETGKRVNILIWIIDIVCIAYFVAFLLWISDNFAGGIMEWIIPYVNPFTVGVYVIGLAAVITLLFSGSTILKILMVMTYLAIAFTSLAATMGISSQIGLTVFLLIRVLFVAAFVVIIVIKVRKNRRIT